MGTADKRLAIENNSIGEFVNYGLVKNDYLIVKTINLKQSSNSNDRVFRLGVRVYPLAHSRNLMGIDFKLISPRGESNIIIAGTLNHKFTRWTDLALSLVPIFWGNELGDYSMILSNQLGGILKSLIPTVRRNTQTIPTSNKTKLAKTKKANYIKKITR